MERLEGLQKFGPAFFNLSFSRAINMGKKHLHLQPDMAYTKICCLQFYNLMFLAVEINCITI
jgi:hypothetical protein